MRVLLKPPTTPPLTLILFASLHVLSASLDFGLGLLRRDLETGSTILDVLRFILAAAYAWLAGTLPIQPILPAENVARSTDVCTTTFLL